MREGVDGSPPKGGYEFLTYSNMGSLYPNISYLAVFSVVKPFKPD
jgi:hypothetical protein